MANGAVLLKWRDRNWAEHGHYVYRSDTPMDINNLPSPIGTLSPNEYEYIDYDVIADQTYYYRIGAFRNNDVSVSDEIEVVATPYNNGPGPQELIAGDMTAGFFGEVPTSELITGNDLATQIGLTAGTAQYSTEPWLKFALDGNIIYIAKKPYRHSVSWNDINAVNAVYGDASAPEIVIGGFSMKASLLTGGNSDPASGIGGEWNRLIYRVHQEDPSGTPWFNYNNYDIITGNSLEGRGSWMQETSIDNPDNALVRGNVSSGISVISYSMFSKINNSVGYGWRPALRLIQ